MIILKWFGIISFLLLLALIAFSSCVTMRTSDKKVNRYFAKANTPVRIYHISYLDTTIRFLETGGQADSTNQNLIIFVHGAPGSSDNFHRYLADSALQTKARLVSVDRLGYGYSDYGNAEPSMAKQAAMLRFVIQQFPEKQAILVGHSFGGPIIAKCAMDYPDLIKSLVLLAPVDDPDHEKMFWFSYFAKWKTTRWVLSKPLRVAGVEKFTHADQLASIKAGWRLLSCPVTHIHGTKDKLAPVQNMDFSEQNIPVSHLKMVELPGTGHFIPWTDYDIVHRELLYFLN